jgi:hypothetical protein
MMTHSPTGKQYTRRQLVGLTDWWLRHPESRTGTITPYIDWLLSDQEYVVKPLAAMVKYSLESADVKVRFGSEKEAIIF